MTAAFAWMRLTARPVFIPRVMQANRLLYLVLLSYCVFSIAMQVFMPYYVLYLRAELSAEEKNAISHRANALHALVRQLNMDQQVQGDRIDDLE